VNWRDNDERNRARLLRLMAELAFGAMPKPSNAGRLEQDAIDIARREVNAAILGSRYALIQEPMLMTEYGSFRIRKPYSLARWVLGSADQHFLLSIGIDGA
jgi:hypothetical protein